jgi:hypothetical protein
LSRISCRWFRDLRQAACEPERSGAGSDAVGAAPQSVISVLDECPLGSRWVCRRRSSARGERHAPPAYRAPDDGLVSSAAPGRSAWSRHWVGPRHADRWPGRRTTRVSTRAYVECGSQGHADPVVAYLHRSASGGRLPRRDRRKIVSLVADRCGGGSTWPACRTGRPATSRDGNHQRLLGRHQRRYIARNAIRLTATPPSSASRASGLPNQPARVQP